MNKLSSLIKKGMRKTFGLSFVAILLVAMLVPTLVVRADADWWDTSWVHRNVLSFNAASIGTNLTDFAVRVELDSTKVDFSLIKVGGADIRFVDKGNLVELPYEIEYWDDVGETAVVWVKAPQIDASSAYSDYIYIYYDNAIATDNQDAEHVWGDWDVISNCEATTDWSASAGGTLSLDVTTPVQGTYSILNTVEDPASATTEYTATYAPAGTWDMSREGENLDFWFKCSRDETAFTHARVYVYEGANYSYWDLAWTGTDFVHFDKLTAAEDGVSGTSPDLSAIDKIVFNVKAADNTTFTYNIDWIEGRWGAVLVQHFGSEAVDNYKTAYYDSTRYSNDGDSIYTGGDIDISNCNSTTGWTGTSLSLDAANLTDTKKVLDTTTYDAFGFDIMVDSNTIAYFYRQGTTHVGDNAAIYGVFYTISTNTFGTPFLVYDSEYDDRNVGGGIIDGKFYVFFGRYTCAGGPWFDMGYVVSTDLTEGTAWGTFNTVAVTPTEVFSPSGSIFYDGNKYYQPFYGWTGATYICGMYETEDNGTTWVESVQVIYSGAEDYTEVAVAYRASDNKAIALCRENSGDPLRQFTNSNFTGGTTWVDAGNTNLGNIGHICTSPSMVYNATNDIWVIAYGERTVNRAYVSYADPDTIFTSPTSWYTPIVIPSITGGGGPVDLGYPTICQGATDDSFWYAYANDSSANDIDTPVGKFTYTTGQSLKDTVASPEAATEYKTTYNPAGSWYLGDRNLNFWLKSDTASTDFTWARIYITDTSAASQYKALTFDAEKWKEFDIESIVAEGAWTGAADLTAIDKVEFNFKATDTDTFNNNFDLLVAEGGPTWKGNTSLEFDGVNDYLNCGKDDSIDFPASDFTLEFDYSNTSGSHWGFFSKGYAFHGDNGYGIGYENSKASVALGNAGRILKSGLLADHTYCAVSFDRDGYAIAYLDGAQSGDTPVDISGVGSVSTNSPLCIGKYGSTIDLKWQGDNLCIFNTVRTPSEIKASNLSKSDTFLYYGGEDCAPTVTTDAATDVYMDSTTHATLNGTLDSLGGVPTCDTWFEWGYDTSYGNIVGLEEGVATTGTHSYTLTSYDPSYTVHYRFVGENVDGRTNGADQSFLVSGNTPSIYKLLTVLPYIFVGIAILMLVVGVSGGMTISAIIIAAILAIVGAVGIGVIQSILQSMW